ncbi:MAG: hypothetical protein R3F49_01205 [Planctomycetota bacterium]
MKPKLDPWRIALFIVAFACLAGYAYIEARGVAFGGRVAPERVTAEQLRSSRSGSSTFIYWAHGSRGK